MKNKLSFGKKTRVFLIIQAVFLAIGSVVGWMSVISEVQSFCQVEGVGLGGLFTSTGTFATNPLLQPCFWGSLAFTGIFIWTVLVLMSRSESYKKSLRQMKWVLLGATLFALFNNVMPIYNFITSQTSEPDGFACPSTGNPFQSACFFGLLAFALAFSANMLANFSLARQIES